MIKGQNLKQFERFKRFRLKSCRSISLPVKNMALGAPRGHITTGIFSTDKVSDCDYEVRYIAQNYLIGGKDSGGNVTSGSP